MGSRSDMPTGTVPALVCALGLFRIHQRGRLTSQHKALLAAVPLLTARLLQGLRAKAAAELRHPGTAAHRTLCRNPSVPASDFERRFLGESADLGRVYDFIVVGAGSAGCACAARLAKSGASVLLVEAGGEAHRSGLVQQPCKMLGAWQSEVDWGFRSTPQEHLLPRGRVLDLERGKTLGGSSAINYMMWVRGAKEDFDRWATEFGCPGWSYEEVLPHFRSIERVSSSRDVAYDPVFRGESGAVAANVLHPALPEVNDFIAACEGVGAKRTGDYNGADMEGVSATQVNTGNSGLRQDAFSAFIEPLLRHYPNLHVVSESYCRRVLLSGSGKNMRADGVELELGDGRSVSVRCAKEVILSAGALMSPQLLMLSGIGREAELKKHGIPCKLHVPAVGKNLYDHTAVSMVVQLKPEAAEVNKGRVLDTGCMNGVYFWKSRVDALREERASGPDMETILVSRIDPTTAAKFVMEEVQSKVAALTPDMRSNSLFSPLTSLTFWLGRLLKSGIIDIVGDMVIISTVNNHPVSRGSVKLRSANPHDLPLVDVNYFSEPSDMEAAVESVRRMLKILDQPEMKKNIQGLQGMRRDASDEEIQKYVRRKASSTWHYSCTTRMGPDGDESCVCDARGRVRGVHNLRIADAGLMPYVVSGNTNAASIMIGDRVGHFLAEDNPRSAAAFIRSSL